MVCHRSSSRPRFGRPRVGSPGRLEGGRGGRTRKNTPTGSRRRGAVAQRRGSGNGAAARHGTPTRGGSAGAAERTAEGPGNAGDSDSARW
ncbi:unnamed protein product [Prorocentrum cordatum]|uniref:Uncharacterized protein n=1 Tax=Prorocentrum cordatum TaxID=2364126 RepID=A0ABN9RFD3_9DINO|nr:unnamed protein product [Polarella glacialis]